MAYLIPQLLRNSSLYAPDSLAVAGEDGALSYSDLDQLADRVASALAGMGVDAGDTVAVHAPKSPYVVAALYGIMRRGAAYVPVDHLAPPERAAFILNDCDARALVTTLAGWKSLAPILERNIPTIVTESQAPAGTVSWSDVEAEDRVPSHEGTESDLAYILYTSGSTGRPKGVMITHRNALTFIDWCVAKFRPRENDRFASHAPFHFDLSIHDLYVAAAARASVHLIPAEVAYFPAAVDAFIRERSLTVWYSVPTALVRLTRFLAGAGAVNPYPSLRLIHFAGEVYPIKELRVLRVLMPDARLFNLYGPTETNVCTYYEVRGPELEKLNTLPIGRACSNMEVMAVADGNRLAQVGEEGELWVRGPGVTPGYVNLPEETADRLRRNPFSGRLHEMAYRTGDIVVQTTSGDYEFHGRKDHQVKLRGFRIELGEIEAVLTNHAAVSEAAAVIVEASSEDGEAELHAFCMTDGTAVSSSELVAWCRARLPGYMMPAKLHVMDALPRTSTGKIDRKRLSVGLVATGP
jgi:amino acid adenylation domain-containing protein